MKSEVNEDASLEIFFLFDGVGPPSLKLYLQNAEFHNCGMKYVKSKVCEGVILQFFFPVWKPPPSNYTYKKYSFIVLDETCKIKSL